MTRKVFSLEQIEEIKTLYTDNLLSLSEIGKIFSVTYYTIGRVLIEEGIRLRPNGKRTEKICKRCGERKPINEFFKDAVCKRCRAAHNREMGYSYKKYKMDYADYLEMYKCQNGNCAICGEHKDLLFVDHNHSTGQVRKLLCNRCNHILGSAMDNIELLKQAMNYLANNEN